MAGWPAGYPRRGAWRFRNVRREFQFWPTLQSIEVTQEYPDMVATFSCEVVDQDEGYEFAVEDEVRVFFEKAGEDEVRIFAGHLKVVTLDREDEFGPRKWYLEAQDYTAKLGDAIIRQRAHRKKETAIRRIRWIVGYLKAAWHLDGRDYDVPDEDVEREDMFGMTVAEALDSVANEVGLRYWVDLDNVLHVHKTKTVSAPFSLDNDAPDYSTSFPFREFSWRRDSTDLANAVLVEPEKREDSRWATAPANIAQYEWGDSTGRQERFISAEEIRTARAAERKADVQLQRLKAYDSEGTLVCYEPGLYAGMHVGLVEALWDVDTTVRIIRVDISAEDPHGATGTALLRSELTVTNKPKRRSPRMGRPEGETADTTPHVIDDFDREVEPPSTSAGDAIGPWTPMGYIDNGQNGYAYTGFLGSLDITGPGAWYGPTWHDKSSLLPDAKAVSGPVNISWPYSACGIGYGSWSGYYESESWWRLLIPEHPVGMTGIRFDVEVGAQVGAASNLAVRVGTAQPTGMRGGSQVGIAPQGATTSIFIPAANIPAEGEYLWLALAPGWQPTGFDNGIYACITNPTNPQWSGERNSGFVGGEPGAATWEILDSGSTDWGSSESDPDAPWEGGNDWQSGATEGSPTAGMTDGAFYVTGSGGQGIFLSGEAEDEDQPAGPWSGVDCCVEVRYTVDDLVAGGSITVTNTGQGAQTIGTIDLDTTPTITVAAPTDSDTAAITIDDDEVWVAKFDSRAGVFRGKTWEAGTPEPAAWDVEVAMTDTEDDADRLELMVRSGASQTVRVLSIGASASARNGQRVVTEWLGHASGSTNRFVTNHRYREGTLEPLINGVVAPATREDGVATTFRLDAIPTAGSKVRASYIADTGEE